MQNKRIVVRMLIRGLYAGGIIFLVSGVLLSALSLPVLAAGNALSPGSAQLQPAETATECAACNTATPFMPLETMTPGGTGPSSLIFASGCDCSCTTVNTTVCNVGGPMQVAARWDLFFSANGNPTLGERIKSGSLGPLDAGTCITLDNVPSTAGNYAYVLKQEPNHAGPGTVWSSACLVSGLCFPNTATPTSTSTSPAITDTPTAGPTPTDTSAPMAINLSAVCDYPSDNFLLWKVANNTGQALDYVWRVVGTAESGSGTVQANADDYFTSSPGSKTVRLFVANELVDSEASVAPCKQDLVLSYTCTGTGLDWTLRNPNTFAVDMRWSFDNGQVFTDVLAAGEVRIIGSTTPGAHTVVVEWMDARPVNHQVTLSSTDASCGPLITPATPTFTTTPTETLTPTPTFTATLTPTSTFTQPVISLTPTSTFTQPVISLTPTLTSTNTLVPSATFTPTNTLVPSVTVTPTNTLVPSATFTPTNTLVPSVTVTPTNTLVPSATVTPTNTLIPSVTVTPTNTNTVTATPVNTQGGPPFATSTNTLVPTQTRTITPTNTNVPTNTIVPTNTTDPGTQTPVNTQGAPPLATFTSTVGPTSTFTLVPTATITPTFTQIPTLAAPAQVSTPAIIPVTGEDQLFAARTTGLIGKLFINIGLVLFGMALALNGFQKQMRY